jgi:uncharacterized protein
MVSMTTTSTNPSPEGAALATGVERRHTLIGNSLILLAVTGFSAIPFADGWLGMLSIGLAVTLALATVLRSPAVIQMTLVATTLALAMQMPALRVASLPMLLTLLAFALVVLAAPTLRRSLGWLRRGTLDLGTYWRIAGVAAVSGTALLGWHALTHPDVSALKALVGGMSTVTLIAVGIAFPLVNATVEEIIFRGVMMNGLGQIFRSALVVNLVQATSFGLLHKDGFPSGAWGIALAGLYAFLLGLLRLRSGGLLAPWIAHVLADAMIFGIIVKLA